MDATYSAALWRDNPTAFWLHPEGPLADSTPAEYFVNVHEIDNRCDLRVGMGRTVTFRDYDNGLHPLQNAYAYQNALSNDYANAMQDIHNRYAGTRALFGGLL